MAGWFGITREAFNRGPKKRPEVMEAIERGQGKGRASLRRAQFLAALKGDRTMLIWLGKQLLGQTDKVENTGPQTAPAVVVMPAPVTQDDWETAHARVKREQEALERKHMA